MGHTELKVPAIKNGTVIDHLPPMATLWVARILANIEQEELTLGINLPSKTVKRKGMIKMANRYLSEEEVDRIAIVAPEATVNIIKDFKIEKKYKVMIPDEVKGLITCPNPRCVTNHQPVGSKFKHIHAKAYEFACLYCEIRVKLSDLKIIVPFKEEK